MIRRAAPQTLTPKTFKHFAAITIGITACLALFTNGEEAERLAHNLDAQQSAAAANVSAAVENRVKPVAKVNAQLRDARRTHVPLAIEAEGSGNFGEPMDATPASGGGSGPGAATAMRSNSRAAIGEAVHLDLAVSTGKPGELPTIRRNPGQQRRPTRKQLEQLEAASTSRSGGD